MNTQNYSTDELRAMVEGARLEEDTEAKEVLQGILDTREASEYAHEVENEASSNSSGTAT